MGPRQLSMVTVQVRDLDAARAWYTDVLGLSVGWLEPGEFCVLSLPGGGPALALATDHPERVGGAGPATGWTPIITVDDFDATLADLRASGVRFDAEEEGADENYRLVRIADPEGNVIGLSA
jgi:catechol 2,3-dioxygenase-like lactoylglutathione lyase family enzyme